MTKREEFIENVRKQITHLEGEKMKRIREVWGIEDEIEKLRDGLARFRKTEERQTV